MLLGKEKDKNGLKMDKRWTKNEENRTNMDVKWQKICRLNVDKN